MAEEDILRELKQIKKDFDRTRTADKGGGGGTDVTLDANAGAILSLTGQELGLDTQTANYVFAGPTGGAAAVPTFRALGDADIPSAIARDSEVTSAISTHAGDASAHHAPVTLAADAANILDLSTQEIGLDVQSANTVLAGPTTGADADPDFRSLVSDDIPSLAAAKISDFDTEVSNNADVAANTSARHAAVTLGADAGAILGLTGQQIDLDTQTANYIFAGPTSGGAADPTFRALVADDVPSLLAAKISDLVETIQDTMDRALDDTTSITWSYNDTTGKITALVRYRTSQTVEITVDPLDIDLGIIANLLYQNSTTVTLSEDASGLKADVIQGGIDHGSIGGLTDDDHTQYTRKTP